MLRWLETAPARSSTRLWPIATLLFLSGATSLTFEVVWTRVLRLHFGTSTLAVSTILVAYMLGLGFGALIAGSLAARIKNAIRIYGFLELGIALYALTVPAMFGAVLPMIHTLLEGADFYSLALARFALATVLLLAPTLLMGATLPVLVQGFVRERAELGRRVGLLYGLNTLGAVAGVLVATFVLFPTLGLWGTNAAAAAAAAGVGLMALVLARAAAPRTRPEKDSSRPPPGEKPTPARITRWSLGAALYGLVGFTALVYEVAWTRALTMVLGSSFYAFSVMLATFLSGIGLGSLLGRRWADRLVRPQAAYAGAAVALGLSAAATALLIGALPDVFLAGFERLGRSRTALVLIQLIVSSGVMLVPAVVLGVLFPLVTRALAAEGRLPGQVVGDLYFTNTLGAALGAFATAFWLVPALGLQQTLAVGIALNLATAAGLLLWQRDWMQTARVPLAFALLGLSAVAVLVPPSWDANALLRAVYWRTAGNLSLGIESGPPAGVRTPELLFYRDGLSASVAVQENAGRRTLRINGKADASDTPGDMQTQVLLAQVPLLFGPPAERVLVIGLGSGVTATSAALHEPEVLDIVEIEPAVVAAARFFSHVHARPLDGVLARLRIDDARSLIAQSHARYDVIIAEPSNPWISGVSNLFTKEFFREVHRALVPGGRLTQWVELYGLKPDELGSILGALTEEFDYVYGFVTATGASDLILLAGDRPLAAREFPRWESLAADVRRDLERIGIFSTAELWSLVRLTPEDVRALATEAPEVNSDDNLYVELRAPWNLAVSFAGHNWDTWGARASGVGPLLAGVPAEMLGAVAEAYARSRAAPALARDLAARAHRNGARVTHLLTQASLAAVDEDLFRARSLLELAVALEPAGFLPRLLKADVRLRTRDPEGALADANAALAARPDDPRARLLRVRALRATGRAAEALGDVAWLSASPYARHHHTILPDLAVAASSAGQPRLAVELLRRYTRLEPNAADAWLALARYCDQAGLHKEAARSRKTATRARRNRVRELHRRARAAVWMEEPSRAVTLLEQAVALDPGYGEARLELVRLRRVQTSRQSRTGRSSAGR
ncbi:MAG: fused MFS/spermidine synthase [Gammaproteobacteria bacterium]|nr:fused MFS/spermidine synthase [Gammaproteobacteria bacterium]